MLLIIFQFIVLSLLLELSAFIAVVHRGAAGCCFHLFGSFDQ